MSGLPSDDDDMPEEVTLNEGREDARQSRRNEKENSKRLTAELKEKRKSRSEKKRKEGGADTKQKPDENEEETSGLAVKEKSRKRKGRRGDGEELERKHGVGPVMLDESVVQLLRAREKQVKAIGEAKHKYIEEEPLPEPEPKAKKSSKSDHDLPINSRTQIVSLKAKPNAAAANSALEFRRNHFFGSQVKRSVAMLPTSKRPHLASV